MELGGCLASPTGSARPKCYIAGPMRGVQRFNFDAFDYAKRDLEGAGFDVFSPRDNDADLLGKDYTPPADGQSEGKIPFKTFMAKDLMQVCQSDCVFVLPGWEESKGATLEAHVAWQVDVPVYEYDMVRELVPPQEERPNGLSLSLAWIDEWPRHQDAPFGPIPGDAGPVDALDFGPGLPKEMETYEPTGGRKGRREAAMASIPVYARVMEARVHGFALAKYPDAAIGTPNWTLGVPLSWFADAQERHYVAWLAGRTYDEESGLPNQAHARWMSASIMEIERLIALGKLPAELDDRRRQ